MFQSNEHNLISDNEFRSALHVFHLWNRFCKLNNPLLICWVDHFHTKINMLTPGYLTIICPDIAHYLYSYFWTKRVTLPYLYTGHRQWFKGPLFALCDHKAYTLTTALVTDVNLPNTGIRYYKVQTTAIYTDM